MVPTYDVCQGHKLLLLMSKRRRPKTQKDPKTHRNYTLKIKPKLIRCALEPLRESGPQLYMIRSCMLLHKGMLRARRF